jgi:hypothetical protein
MSMNPDNRHKWALPYWARPGIVFAKAADDGGGADDDDLDDEDDEDDEDDDPDEGKTEDELRAELKAVRESLSKASGSSKAKRDKIKSLTRELDAARVAPKGKPKAKAEDDDGPDIETIRETAKLEGIRAGEKTAKVAKVVAALADAGVDKAARPSLARMIDVDEFDLDDDEAVDEALAELKKTMPALFAAPKRKRSVAGEKDGSGERESGSAKKKDASQKQADILLGRG